MPHRAAHGGASCCSERGAPWDGHHRLQRARARTPTAPASRDSASGTRAVGDRSLGLASGARRQRPGGGSPGGAGGCRLGERGARARSGPGGIYARLAELGHGPVHFREEIRSRKPLPEEAAKLRLPAGTPVMLICRTAFAEGGRVVEVNEMVLDAAGYVLEYDFDA
ncbi:UTRA domain-containing protein [Streptomyces sp. CA-278952]|nr:UTRA domain-containing protein [Streptomyces sp. CA-278952]WDG31406.1 UTRA domain-containing protein [Streptomyces sp. CA-278952]